MPHEIYKPSRFHTLPLEYFIADLQKFESESMTDRLRNKAGHPVYLQRNVSFYSLHDLIGVGSWFFDLESCVRGFRLASCSCICFARTCIIRWSNVNTEVRGVGAQLVSRTDLLSRNYRVAHAHILWRNDAIENCLNRSLLIAVTSGNYDIWTR